MMRRLLLSLACQKLLSSREPLGEVAEILRLANERGFQLLLGVVE